MSKLLLLFLGLFIAAAAIDVAAAAPLQYDKAASRASETSTRIAAALVLPELSHISPPSDQRICLTNILMTYFRCCAAPSLAHHPSPHAFAANLTSPFCGLSRRILPHGGSAATALKSFVATVWLS
jgi:hypothetical protein